MAMAELNEAAFHDAARTAEGLTCVFASGAEGADIAASLTEALGSRPSGPVAHIDTKREPTLCKAMGIGSDASVLVVMREAIVLYLAPCRDPSADAAIVARAHTLDIAAIKAQIAQDEAARALFSRRVCPTAHRQRR